MLEETRPAPDASTIAAARPEPPEPGVILDHAPVVVCSPTGRVTWASGPGAALIGPAAYLPSLLDAVADDDRDRVAREMARLAKTPGAKRRTEFGLEQSDGSRIHLVAEATCIADPDGSPSLVLCLHDMTARHELERELYHRALHDPLTGLPNRALLEDRLEQATARLRRAMFDEALVVLYVDIDRFKSVNDNHGHEAGDRVVREVARRLVSVTRPGDTVARVGGDEFVIVCPETSSGVLDEMARRLHTTINEPVDVPSGTIQVTASIGVAVAHTADAHPAQIVRTADAAMYRAKRAGRGRVIVGYAGE
jgi:diguanylate cyclase (GGDEF)-like protein